MEARVRAASATGQFLDRCALELLPTTTMSVRSSLLPVPAARNIAACDRRRPRESSRVVEGGRLRCRRRSGTVV